MSVGAAVGNTGPLIGIVILALDLFALYFIIKSKASAGMKLIWVVLVVLVPFVGAVAYFLVNGTGAPPSDSTSHQTRGQNEQGFGK
jgi:uncharacterized protein (UPF0333 family)